jgi:hypothetical protein
MFTKTNQEHNTPNYKDNTIIYPAISLSFNKGYEMSFFQNVTNSKFSNLTKWNYFQYQNLEIKCEQ